VLSIKISERHIEQFEQGRDIKSIRKIAKRTDTGYRLRLLCYAPISLTRSEL